MNSNSQHLTEIRAAVKRIEVGLFGDDEMGQMGLVKKVANHNARLKRLERCVIYLGGGAGAAAVIYRVAMDLWPRK